MSVLLSRAARMWMMVVGLWGLCGVVGDWVAAVQSVGISGEECTQVTHRRMHNRCCDRWGSRAQSFLGRTASGRKLSAWSAAESGW